MLTVPMLSGKNNGPTTPSTTTGGSAFSTLNSPFTTADNTHSFSASVRDYKILINAIQQYKNPVNYSHELFTREIVKANIVKKEVFKFHLKI